MELAISKVNVLVYIPLLEYGKLSKFSCIHNFYSINLFCDKQVILTAINFVPDNA